jgi:hypothetical protein
MYQSEQINELATALAKAQGEIAPAIKDKNNPFFKSSYADLSSIWNACKVPLSKNGLAVLQTTETKDGQLILITTLAHASGQWIRSYLPVLSEKQNAQGLGSALTYMRRYALSAMVGVTSDEDDDGNACSAPERKREYQPAKEDSPKKIINRDQVKTIENLIGQCDETFVRNVRNYYAKEGVHSWEQLPVDKYDGLYRNLSSKIQSRNTEMAGAA